MKCEDCYSDNMILEEASEYMTAYSCEDCGSLYYDTHGCECECGGSIQYVSETEDGSGLIFKCSSCLKEHIEQI